MTRVWKAFAVEASWEPARSSSPSSACLGSWLILGRDMCVSRGQACRHRNLYSTLEVEKEDIASVVTESEWLTIRESGAM
ncbi:hypothetical protein Ahy_A10g046815 isoform D [Arachis hypogaea]|uniref:Uncharacterized protein n=1 Tax=Arachis hypogaea TaxID=3818 RepID=A0A445B0L7_ARAHY|nr:hypothetical protein Ahy_A10g046815 isoform D [Arachis hypogaea]